jgi:predicted nucleic acid-binding protein
MPKGTISKYNKFVRRSNVAAIPFDHSIAELTSEIRGFYVPTDFELLTPDAIHLATAIHVGVGEFQTFDGLIQRVSQKQKVSRDAAYYSWLITLLTSRSRYANRLAFSVTY